MAVVATHVKSTQAPLHPLPVFRAFDIHETLAMSGMDTHALLVDDQHDAVLLAGWGASQLVLSCRGTNTTKNVMADARAWPVRHYNPAVRRQGRLFDHYARLHQVHGALCVCVFLADIADHVQGFVDAWTSVREATLSLVMERMAVARKTNTTLTITCTGHSLGGAMATLAAWDIATLLSGFPATAYTMRCYTFGAPRVGDHTFAALYKRLVPNTWDVANDQDVVPKMTKWMRVYKRTGHRVFVRKVLLRRGPAVRSRRKLEILGDIIVRPTWIELNVVQKTFANSIGDHRCSAYVAAFAAVIAAQFDMYKALSGGPEGATRLLQTPVAQVVVDNAVQHNSRLSMGTATSDLSQAAEATEGPAALDEEQGVMQEERVQQAKLLRRLSHRLSSVQRRGDAVDELLGVDEEEQELFEG